MLLLCLAALLLAPSLPAEKLKPMPPQDVPAFLEASIKPFTDQGSLKGVVVGVILGGKKIEGAWGVSGVKGLAMDKDTLFEIASVTKTFNGLLLAQLLREGKMKLEDPLQRTMPEGVKVPDWEGKPVTLLHLATHTSGLPVPGPQDQFLPKWHSPKGLGLLFLHLLHWDFSNPLLGIGEKDVYAFLKRTKLKREPGTQWEYCNLGMGLLGLAMARADGAAGYEDLLRRRVAAPLEMDSTWVVLPPALKSRLAQGYNEAGKPSKRLALGPLAAAGGLKSSLSDLMKYAALHLKSSPSPLRPAALDTHQVQFTLTQKDFVRPLTLTWHMDAKTSMLHHSGTGLGSHAWIGILEKQDAALVILSNSAAQVVEEIGPELLKRIAGWPAEVPTPLVAVTLPAEKLERLAGLYMLDKQPVAISRNGDHLDVVFGKKKPTALWPKGELSYFCKEWDCRMEFKLDQGGEVKGVDIKMYYNTYFAPLQK